MPTLKQSFRPKELPEHIQQKQQVNEKKPSKKSVLKTIKPIEFIWVAILGSILLFMSANIISTYTDIFQKEDKIVELEANVDELNRDINELKTEVDELSRYERIMKIAEKLGLKLNEENVKIVE